MIVAISAFNERLAVRITSAVSTMTCAYLFALLAILGLPQALHDTFDAGFHSLPLVTWVSQAFLQLVLLSIIMVGQQKLSEGAEARARQDHAALREILADIREDHAALRKLVECVSIGET